MDISTLGAAKSYTDTVINGLSILVGKNCEISNIEVLPNGNKITFTWWDSNNVQQSNDITVLNGEQGIQGLQGVSTTNIEINEENHLIFTLSDSTIIDAGEIINGVTNYENLNNKPTINGVELIGNKSTSDLGIEIPTVTNDLTNVLKSNYDNAYTHSQSVHAPSNAEANVQSDWNETDNTSDAFIKNKPTIIAEIPEYNIIKVQDDDYVFVYQLTKTIDEEIVNVGEAINIPKDMVVQSGEIKTCATVNVPVSGYKVGDKYIDLLIANSNNQHIYILVSDLVDNNASGIKYDNTSSGLVATNVQTAINELNTNKASKAVATSSTNGLLSSTDKALIDVIPRSKSIDQILGINVYKDFVVPLVEVTAGIENTFFYGQIFLKRTNNSSDEITIINAMCGKRYNKEEATYSIDSSEVFTPIKPCIFTYNSKKYFGIHVNITSSEYEIFRVDARTTTNYNDIKMIFVYDTSTSQIINAEIYNSLNFAATGKSVSTNFYAVPQLVDGTAKRKLLYFSPVPATLTSTGTAGDVAYDTNYLYTCITTNTWKKTAFDVYTYSKTETVVGTYMGKPLYRKIVDCGALPNNTTKEVLHGVSNLNIITNISGTAWMNDGITIPLPTASLTSPVVIYGDRTKLYLTTITDRSTMINSNVIIEYTKTTD